MTKLSEPPNHTSLNEVTDAELHRFGYAPGNYLSKCHGCGRDIFGCDKRCRCCRDCAVKSFHHVKEYGDKRRIKSEPPIYSPLIEHLEEKAMFHGTYQLWVKLDDVIALTSTPDRVADELRQIIAALIEWEPSLKDSESILRLESLVMGDARKGAIESDAPNVADSNAATSSPATLHCDKDCSLAEGYTGDCRSEISVVDIENAIRNAQPERIIVRQELRQRDNKPIEVLHEQTEYRVTPAQQALAVFELIHPYLRTTMPVLVEIGSGTRESPPKNEVANGESMGCEESDRTPARPRQPVGFTDCEKAMVHKGYHKMSPVYQLAFSDGWEARTPVREPVQPDESCNERVARAICKADMVLPNELSLGSGKPRWTQYITKAKAAISAMPLKREVVTQEEHDCDGNELQGCESCPAKMPVEQMSLSVDGCWFCPGCVEAARKHYEPEEQGRRKC